MFNLFFISSELQMCRSRSRLQHRVKTKYIEATRASVSGQEPMETRRLLNGRYLDQLDISLLHIL